MPTIVTELEISIGTGTDGASLSLSMDRDTFKKSLYSGTPEAATLLVELATLDEQSPPATPSVVLSIFQRIAALEETTLGALGVPPTGTVSPK